MKRNEKKKILISKTRIPVPKPTKVHGHKGYDRNKIKDLDRKKEEKKPLHLKNLMYNRIRRK